MNRYTLSGKYTCLAITVTGLGKQRSSLIWVYTVCHHVRMVWTHYSVVKQHGSNFKIITKKILGVQTFRIFTINIFVQLMPEYIIMFKILLGLSVKRDLYTIYGNLMIFVCGKCVTSYAWSSLIPSECHPSTQVWKLWP